MKHNWVRLLFILLFVSGMHVSAGGDFLGPEALAPPFRSLIGNDLSGIDRSPSRRSLLSAPSERDTALVAALNGTIYLLEPKSGKAFWSFTSGPSIYSSYQAPVNHDNDQENAFDLDGFFIDCGDEWDLYVHHALGKLKLSMNVEEFVSTLPYVAEDGGIILGSKQTTVFLVDARTGRVIYNYRLSDSSHTPQSNEEVDVSNDTAVGEEIRSMSNMLKPDELPLYITRTDYLLKSFYRNSDKVLWNMTVAEIGAAFLCQDTDNVFTGTSSDLGYEFPSDPGLRFNMPLPCQSKAIVYRFRGHGMLGPSYRPNMLRDAHDEDLTLSMSSSIDVPQSPPKVAKLLERYHENKILPLPAPDPVVDIYQNSHQNNDWNLLPSNGQLTKNLGVSHVHNVKLPRNSILEMLSEWSRTISLISCAIVLVFFVTYTYISAPRKQVDKEPSNLNTGIVALKRKKNRKLWRNNGIVEKKEPNITGKDGYSYIESGSTPWFNITQAGSDQPDGRVIGKLFVSNREIAKGSNGTIVLEGVYEGRLVAVKRLVKAHHDVAFKEIQNLIASDRHPNIVRWYGVEYDQDFVYLSLERCSCSLNDLILMCSDTSKNPTLTEDQSTGPMVEYKVRLPSMKTIMQDTRLWKANGCPSPILLKLMRDVVAGLVHLHDLGIIHRDLKPQNVLIIKERILCAKLSDMGISKCLAGDKSSLGHHATGSGSSGWQAPEQLLQGRQTRAVDMFSLGCVLFFCITGGKHPFGDRLERDVNIVKNQPDLFLVEYIPEAADLLSRLLNPNADLRLKAMEAFVHPFFWSSEMRLSFLRDTSDRVELEDRETESDLLKALESTASVALGTKWDEKMEPAFVNNIGRYRRYKFNSVRDLLRVMRNKLNHYRELPTEIQEILGPVPEGFDGYFGSRFPKLFIEVYNVIYKCCKEEECFQKYFKISVE